MAAVAWLPTAQTRMFGSSSRGMRWDRYPYPTKASCSHHSTGTGPPFRARMAFTSTMVLATTRSAAEASPHSPGELTQSGWVTAVAPASTKRDSDPPSPGPRTATS